MDQVKVGQLHEYKITREFKNYVGLYLFCDIFYINS